MLSIIDGYRVIRRDESKWTRYYPDHPLGIEDLNRIRGMVTDKDYVELLNGDTIAETLLTPSA